MYIGALETSIATSTLNDKKVSNGTYEINKGNICLEYSNNKCTNELKVDVKGEIPSSGKITVSNRQLVDLILNYENKTIVKSDNKLVYSYKEAKNIEVPDLYNNTLTPVIYDGSNWVIADVSEKWYNYNNQEWANAVLLANNVDKEKGDPLNLETEVLAMLVWIPRYEYKIEGTYGKYGNSDYEGREKEIYINNSAGYYTGRSGGSYGGNTPINETYTDQTDVTTQYVGTGFYTYDGYLLSYNTNTKTETRDMKKIASTTGNIYGVYDMSGGAWEYTMGVFANSDGELWSGNSDIYSSGFKGKVGAEGINIEGLEWPEEKYYDVYKASSGITINNKTACNGGICYGHALNETANWYGDYSSFVSAYHPWFINGNHYDTGDVAGVFCLSATNGHAHGILSTRVVLSSNT